MSNSNPTIGFESQFTPFQYNVMGNVFSTNPTKTYSGSQFEKSDPNWLGMNLGSNGIILSTLSGSTNITSNFGGSFAKGLGNAALNAVTSLSGAPKLITIDSNKHATGWYESIYATLPIDKFKPIPGIRFQDFRSRIPYKNITARRFDGASAAIRSIQLGSYVSSIYAATSAIPDLGGAYTVFNIGNDKYFGAGIGDEGNPSAIINDFTMRSHVATAWRDGKWKPTRYPNEIITPFRGDRVSIIDYGTRKIKNEYLWNPRALSILKETTTNPLGVGLTQDFIKFYFTGPKLHNGSDTAEDDVIVFRALINGLSDSFNANWTNVQLIGRADPNYQYTGYGRTLSLDFSVFATDRDEVKPIWRKLNAMAGYTAPEYDNESIAMKAPWMRITIGDLFVRQPAILTSLTYTLQDSDTTWEINIEDDPTMMQVPHKISVSCEFTLITDYLPQKGGRFYTLAKKFDATGSAERGDDNWLSDFKENVDREIRPKVTQWVLDKNQQAVARDLESSTNYTSTTTEVLSNPNSNNGLVSGINQSDSLF